MLNFSDFIQVYVFSTNHHLNIFAYRLTMFYSCSNNREYISNGADMISLLKGTKGRNSVKYVGGVTILALCELSVCVLYLYQLS